MKPTSESKHGNEILSDEQSILLSHSYDGIEEFDNPTPGWWHLIFFATFVFSLLYIPLFHFGGSMPSVYDNYERSVTAYYESLFADVGDLQRDEASLLEIMHAPEYETFDPVAKSVFIANCAACHGSDASGGTGPNLTDESYINITNLEEIATVIAVGANNGAMPAWEGRLHPNQIALLAAYVAELRGKNLPGKAPEGEVPSPWPAYEPESN